MPAFFRLRGGLIALGITAVTSIPFILTPYIFGRPPLPNEIRDLSLQVGFILLNGLLITLLFEAQFRRSQAEREAEALRVADQMKNTFISVASHELRTPLTAIMGFSDLLLNSPPVEGKAREWLGHIRAESARLAKLTEDLLNISRLQSGRLTVRPEPLEVSTVVGEALRSSPPSPKHICVVDCPPDLPRVRGDREKVIQVLVNLVSNAVKYSPNGGTVTVRGRWDAQRGAVVVSVIDQGIGIAPEDARHLFTTFYRVHRKETERIPGAGLGLYIVKSLVNLMGGEVWVESQVGKGSTFSFTLPVWQEAPASLSPPAPRETVRV
ncbi:Alkaline phosphatase synthesis sensor protein PhoR [bacterium HR23]|nr:Alkaline phosphatase synthesis sensor protein PhoR [bacterium HR23]